MLPAPLAFAWLFWRQNRIWLLVTLCTLLAVAAASAVLPAHCSRDAAEFGLGLALFLTVPVMTGFVTFVWGGNHGDVLGRESCFPPSLFRLPLSTRALATWPMVYGPLACVLFWPTIAGFILAPWLARLDKTVPLWWPAMLAAAALAWVQALTWAPFGLRWLRVVLVMALWPLVSVLASFGADSGADEGLLVGVFACLAVCAGLVGYVGVRQARRGYVPDWEGIYAPLRRLARRLPHRRQPFASSARAQVWFEWRQTGLSLAIMTVLVLPVGLVPLWFGANDVLPAEQTLLSALLYPVFLAGIAGPYPGTGRNAWVKDKVGMPPFLAALPLSDAAQIGAMLRAALWSTLAAWGIMALLVALAVLSNLQTVTTSWQQTWRDYSPGQVASGVTAVAVLLLVWTWKRRVDSLYLSLTGRAWIMAVVLWACFSTLICLGIAVGSIYNHPERRATALLLLPWLLGPLVLIRLLFAAWALREVLSRGLLQPRTAVRWVTAWLVVATALFGLLAATVPPQLVPVWCLAFAVVFAMPLARLAASPLALAWNRHGRLPPRLPGGPGLREDMM